MLVVAAAITVYAAGGSKKTAEECKEDKDCSRGHCHTKQDGKKVCVDCDSSKIRDLRGKVQRYCKDEFRKCDDVPKLQEVAESYFTTRIEAVDRCIAARKEENTACWAGGDQGHRDQVKQFEQARKKCYDELNTRKGTGGIYSCSDSTYKSRASDVDKACNAYGKACADWSKDDKVVDCRAIEDAMKKADACVDSVKRLDSECLPRLGSWRESQFDKSKEAYDRCKDVLAYKTGKKLCK